MQAYAAHYWKVTMSDPTITNQTRNFNIDYGVLSTDKSDVITVSLVENGSVIDTESAIPGGDSGSFNVTVPADGTYTYNISAKSGNDGDTKTTNSKKVTVVTPVEGQPSQISSSDVNPGGGEGADTQGTNNQDGTGEEGSNDSNDDEGLVEAATDDDSGVVGDDAAATERANEDDSNTYLYILAVIGIAGLAYYLFARYRASKIEI